MTVIQARKILGEEGKRLSDIEIKTIIECFEIVIEVGFQQFETKIKSKEACNEKRNA